MRTSFIPSPMGSGQIQNSDALNSTQGIRSKIWDGEFIKEIRFPQGAISFRLSNTISAFKIKVCGILITQVLPAEEVHLEGVQAAAFCFERA